VSKIGCGPVISACEYRLHLSEELIALANSRFPGQGDTTIPDEVFCEIQENHAGSHFALVQAFGNNEAWAEWATQSAGIRYFPDNAMCEAEGPHLEDPEDDDALCELPAGHYGEHSFNLRHLRSAGRDPSPDIQAKIAELLDQET
jgi:hypothetical protein